MRRFNAHILGIDDGDVVLFSDFEHNGPMWTGDGPRLKRVSVKFSEPFLDPPSVQVGLSMWDISNEATARVDVRAEDVTTKGFKIAFRTWGDTRIARARVSWRAIGELETDEDWQLY